MTVFGSEKYFPVLSRFRLNFDSISTQFQVDYVLGDLTYFRRGPNVLRGAKVPRTSLFIINTTQLFGYHYYVFII